MDEAAVAQLNEMVFLAEMAKVYQVVPRTREDTQAFVEGLMRAALLTVAERDVQIARLTKERDKVLDLLAACQEEK